MILFKAISYIPPATLRKASENSYARASHYTESQRGRVAIMGKIRQNCWCFKGTQHVWAVCSDCMEKGLERDEYWVNIVPNILHSLDAFKRKIDSGPIKALCNTKEHEITISSFWFSKKNMEEPKL